MRAFARILLVDDDESFNAMLTERLRERGYDVTSVDNTTSALAQLDSHADAFDVAILDLKLDGKDGGDVGIDVLGKVLDRAPSLKPIIITAYADSDSVERAFQRGAYDYVEKTDFAVFEALLLAKIRNAVEPLREARIAALVNGEREAQLGTLWRQVQAAKNLQEKGALLEELLLILWRSVAGFEKTSRNQQNQDEEIDLVVMNQSSDEFWRKESGFFLVECKNWMSKVDPKEIDRLFQKIERKGGRCRLGFFVAPAGFTAGVQTTLLANRKEPYVIVPLAKEAISRLVEAGSSAARNEALKELVQQAVVQNS